MQTHTLKGFDIESFFVKIIFRYSKHAESTGETAEKEGGMYEIMPVASFIHFCLVIFSPSALESSSKSWSGEWAGHSLWTALLNFWSCLSYELVLMFYPSSANSLVCSLFSIAKTYDRILSTNPALKSFLCSLFRPVLSMFLKIYYRILFTNPALYYFLCSIFRTVLSMFLKLYLRIRPTNPALHFSCYNIHSIFSLQFVF